MSVPPELLPITGFARDYQRVYRKLKQSGRPQVLSIHGRAAMIVQDAAAYDRLLDLVESAYLDTAIREAMDDPRPMLSAAQAKQRLRRELVKRAKRS